MASMSETRIRWTYVYAHSRDVLECTRKTVTVREDSLFATPSAAIRASRSELAARRKAAVERGIEDYGAFAAVPVRILGDNPGEHATALHRTTSKGPKAFSASMVNVEYWPEGT